MSKSADPRDARRWHAYRVLRSADSGVSAIAIPPGTQGSASGGKVLLQPRARNATYKAK